MTPDVTLTQLGELPTLAAEVFLTWGCKNPTNRPLRSGRSIAPAAPADLEALDCLRVDSHGLLARLALCVRATVESMPGHPGDLEETPTWVSESDWLTRHHTDWLADSWTAEYVTDEVAAIHRDLSKAARIPAPLRLECPRCHDQLRIQDGGRWLRCDSGHIIDTGAEIERVGRLASMTYPQLSAELGIPQGTLRRWRHSGLIHPDTPRQGGQPVFNVEAVRRVAERVRHG